MENIIDVDVSPREEIRFRCVCASFRVDMGMTEGTIQRAFGSFKSLDGCGYILHDMDVYTEEEAESLQREYELKKAENPAQELSEPPNAGDKKPPHYHILMHFKSQVRLSSLCKAFGLNPETEGRMLRKVSGGAEGFINMMAYLTHITRNARAQGKYEYDSSDVRFVFLPQFKNKTLYNKCKNYKDFKEYYEETESLKEDNMLFMITHKGLTLREARLQDIDYYTKNEAVLKRGRQNYLSLQKPPKTLYNFYIGTYGDNCGAKGGIGKSIACSMLAASLLAQMYPDKDFSDMDDNDLIQSGYVYSVGRGNVVYQNYDGEPIVLWHDMEAYDFIKVFDGVNNFFDAFDVHPKGTVVHVKYGATKILNRINIIDGTQSYKEFINELTKAYEEDTGRWHEQEDKTQAYRRVPFFMEVSPESVTVDMQLQYFFADMPRLQYRYENSYQTAITHKNFLGDKNLKINKPICDKVAEIEDRYNSLREIEADGDLFQVIEDIHEVEDAPEQKEKKAFENVADTLRENAFLGKPGTSHREIRDKLIKNGMTFEYDEAEKVLRWYKADGSFYFDERPFENS